MGERAHRGRAHAPDRVVDASDELRSQICSLASSIHAAEAELVELLVRLDDADGWTGAGIRSLAHWLTLTCGFTTTEANQRARLTHRHGELPALFAAFDAGALSVGATHAAQRVATPDNDVDITDIATRATAPQAATTFAAYAHADADQDLDRPADPPPAEPGADDPDASDPTDPDLWLRTWWETNGQHLRLDARLDLTDGATLLALLDRLRDTSSDTTGCAGHTDGDHDCDCGTATTVGRRDGVTPPRLATRPEAFSDLLRHAGDALTDRNVAGRWTDRFAITVTIDAAALTGYTPGNGTLADGTPVDPGTVRAWADQGWLQGLLTERRRPLFLGRRTRTATPAQRRALLARDRGCAFPGCGHTLHLIAHHVRHWEHGGGTDIDNLVLLCRRHHKLLHDGEYTISIDDGRPHIHSPALEHVHQRPPPTDLLRRRRTHPDPTRRTNPTADPVWRCCEPLTRFALDTFITNLLATPRSGAQAA